MMLWVLKCNQHPNSEVLVWLLVHIIVTNASVDHGRLGRDMPLNELTSCVKSSH